MKKSHLFIIFWLLCLPAANSQNPVPLAQQYVACLGNTVTAGFLQGTPGITSVKWYDLDGVTLLGTGWTWNLLKGTAAVETYYAQFMNGSTPVGALQNVYVHRSFSCGSTVATGCSVSGSVLYKEDFGGNATSDPAVKPTGIPQVDNNVYTYTTNSPACAGCYRISKVGGANGSDWYTNIDDHTYPNDPTRGYALQIDASASAGQFYECQMDDLCAGTTLSFSAWIVSVDVPIMSHPANLVFILEDASGTAIVRYHTGNIPDNSPTWKQYGFDFSVPAGTTSLKLRIINNGTGSSGNDFMMDDIQISLCTPTIHPLLDVANICHGELTGIAVDLFNGAVFATHEYQWYYNPTNSAWVWPPTTWTPIPDNDNTLSLSGTPSESGFYRVVLAEQGNLNNKNCHVPGPPIEVNVISLYREFSETVCQNDAYSFYGRPLTTSGTYYDTVPNLTDPDGCDTMVTLHLTVKPASSFSIYDTICAGQSYIYQDDTLTQSGEYADTLTAQNGCDSVITLYLTVNDPATVYLPQDIICEGKAYQRHGFVLPPFNTPGIYNPDPLRLTTSKGCDSLVYITIKVPEVSVKIVQEPEDFCEQRSALLIAETNNPDIKWSTNARTPEIEIGERGKYSVTVYDSSGQCTATDNITVAACPVFFILPNCITPSKPDDMGNDFFSLKNPQDATKIEVYIYNRWSNCVYFSKDPYFSWDGRDKNGKLMKDEVFTYVMYITPIGGKMEVYKGHITVL